MESARKELGALMRRLAESRGLTAREVGNRTRTSAHDVLRWWDGELCPSGEQWGRMIQYQGQLRGNRELYQRARMEQDLEDANDRAALKRPILDTPKVPALTTSLADKLREVTPAPEPEPAPPPVIPPAIPPAAPVRSQPRISAGKTGGDEALRERMQYARGILLQRPNISISGIDGLSKLVADRFGVSMSNSVAQRVIAEMIAKGELNGRERHGTPTPLSAPTITATSAEPNSDDVNAAIQLLMSAIPNLQSLTLTVDEAGEADVQYEVRRVQVVTASSTLKVRR